MSWLLLRGRNESVESDTSLSSSIPSSASDLASSLATRSSAYPASSVGTEFTAGTSVYGTDYGSEYTVGSDLASVYSRERRRQRKFMRPGRVRGPANTEEDRGRRRVSFMKQPTFVFGLMAVCAVSVGVSFYSLSVDHGYQASSAGTYTNEPTGTPTPIPTPTEIPLPTATSYLDSLLDGGGVTHTPTPFTPTPTVPTFTPTASPTTRGLCSAISTSDLEELSGLPAGAYVNDCALYDEAPQCAIASCEEYYTAEGEVYIFCDIETGDLTVYGELICRWD